MREYLTYDEYLKEVERMSELKPKYTMVDDEEFSKGKYQYLKIFSHLNYEIAICQKKTIIKLNDGR